MSLWIPLVLAVTAAAPHPVRVGSKKFTESVVVGEIATLALQSASIPATHRAELGGTRVLWDALVRGEIDVYPEYTGTLRAEILAGQPVETDAALRAALAEKGVVLGPALGFEDSYALGMRRVRAAELGIRRISDLAQHPELRLGFSHEFVDRADGWPALIARYHLGQRAPQGLEHELSYRALASGAVDVIDLYSTDAEIRANDLIVLEDDLHAFPSYAAVLLMRRDLASRWPGAPRDLQRLAGTISVDAMREMNERAKLGHENARAIAAAFLQERFGVDIDARSQGLWARLAQRTREHLFLVLVSLIAAIALAVPLGIAAAKAPAAGQLILSAVGLIQTIPSLALLVFMIPLLGIGTWPAIAALFVYSLLPIVRNTHAGLVGIASELRDSAVALGLPAAARLRRIELPLASRAILAGIKTAAVINVGTATLGALIGAGGYGQPILTGIRLDDVGQILEGAVPAAALALLVQGIFELSERWLVPRGLRLPAKA